VEFVFKLSFFSSEKCSVLNAELKKFQCSFFFRLSYLSFGFQCKREGFIQKIKDEEGEGCNIHGSLEVNKVAGKFDFALGKSFQQSNVHGHELLGFQQGSYNVRLPWYQQCFGLNKIFFYGILT
jgi:hypothetical protein